MKAALSAAALACAALLSGCSVNLKLEPEAEEGPELVWSGHPTEIGGEAIGPTGITLDIYKNPDSTDGRLRYEITNGCTAGGAVAKGGEVSPHEVLRPCYAEDIRLIGRLTIIAPGGLPAPDQPARLTWSSETAQLSSVRGDARFVRDR